RGRASPCGAPPPRAARGRRARHGCAASPRASRRTRAGHPAGLRRRAVPGEERSPAASATRDGEARGKSREGGYARHDADRAPRIRLHVIVRRAGGGARLAQRLLANLREAQARIREAFGDARLERAGFLVARARERGEQLLGLRDHGVELFGQPFLREFTLGTAHGSTPGCVSKWGSSNGSPFRMRRSTKGPQLLSSTATLASPRN